jgi:hypothetical protein
MKPQTAVEYLFQLIDDFGIKKIDRKAILKLERDHTATQIEALRERLLNEFSLSGQKIMINHIVNEFLKEINDGK